MTTNNNTQETQSNSNSFGGIENDPEIQQLLCPDLLHNIVTKLVMNYKYSLDQIAPATKKDPNTLQMTWKQKGTVILSDGLKKFLEGTQVSDDDCSLWVGFYKSESADDFVKNNGNNLQTMILRVVPELEKLYSEIKQEQLDQRSFPSCGQTFVTNTLSKRDGILEAMMITLVLIEKELEKNGIECDLSKLERTKLDCLIC